MKIELVILVKELYVTFCVCWLVKIIVKSFPIGLLCVRALWTGKNYLFVEGCCSPCLLRTIQVILFFSDAELKNCFFMRVKWMK